MTQTPEDKKAVELIVKYYSILTGMDIEYINAFYASVSNDKRFEDAKQCALLCVEEILKGDHLLRLPLSYWEKVKQSIINK